MAGNFLCRALNRSPPPWRRCGRVILINERETFPFSLNVMALDIWYCLMRQAQSEITVHFFCFGDRRNRPCDYCMVAGTWLVRRSQIGARNFKLLPTFLILVILLISGAEPGARRLTLNCNDTTPWIDRWLSERVSAIVRFSWDLNQVNDFFFENLVMVRGIEIHILVISVLQFPTQFLKRDPNE